MNREGEPGHGNHAIRVLRMDARRGQTQQRHGVRRDAQNSRKKLSNFCGFLFPFVAWKLSPSERVEAAHDSIALRIKTTTTRTRRDAALSPATTGADRPLDATIAHAIDSSLRISFLDLVRPRPALHPSGRQREARAPVAPKSVLLLLVVVVVGDEKRDILVGFRDRRRRRSRWLLARYRPLSISPNTARDSSPERQKRLSITSPSPPRPPVRRCHASVPKAWVTGRTRVPGHARAMKTGWPYRQRGGPGKCGAVRTSRPAAEELSATRGTVASVVRRRRSLFAFCALGGLVRGSPARIADDDITSLRARARRSWVFQGFLLFSFMADIDFSTTSDEINITSDGECCAARVIFPPAG